MTDLCFDTNTSALLVKKKLNTHDNVFCLEDDLSIGPIAAVVPEDRWPVTEALLRQCSPPEFTDCAARDCFIRRNRSFSQALTRNGPFRVWYSNTALEYCGLLFVCRQLCGRDLDVQTCHFDFRENDSFPYTSGFLHQDNWRDRLYTEPLDERLAVQWDMLQTENAPLRVVEFGRVRSVPEDYFDPMLLAFHARPDRCPDRAFLHEFNQWYCKTFHAMASDYFLYQRACALNILKSTY